MTNAFAFVLGTGGITSESAYPYVGHDQKCRPAAPVAKIREVVNLPAQNETALQLGALQNPVSIAVQASSLVWRFYSQVFCPSLSLLVIMSNQVKSNRAFWTILPVVLNRIMASSWYLSSSVSVLSLQALIDCVKCRWVMDSLPQIRTGL